MKTNLSLLFLVLYTCFASAQINVGPPPATLIAIGSSWKYLDDGSNQGTAWYGTAFNDGSWSTGNAEFGYGDGDETTVLSYGSNASAKHRGYYFRKTINVASVTTFTAYTMRMKRDDGVVLYINGIEVYRNNMPTGTITYTTLASSAASDDGATFITATFPASVITTGTNVIAAQVHQNAGNSSDLTFEFELVGENQTVVASTATVFPFGSNWKYLDNGSDQGTLWQGAVFNDGTWASGNGEFGYGDGDETTVVDFGSNTNAKYPTTYFRKTFTVTTIPSYTAYAINLKRDDGIIVYLNGTEIYRENMPLTGVNYTTYSSSNCADDGGSIWTATIPASLVITGTNVIAAEIHQTNATSSDLTFDLNFVAVTNSIAPIVPLIVKGPYLQVATPTSMMIRWETNLVSDSKVMYGTNAASLTSILSNTVASVTHSIELTGLTPYTKYYYNIGSSTVVTQGDTNNYFVTLPVPGTPGSYRFWIVSDCGNASTNQVNVKNAYKNYNGNKVTNGWLHAGDLVYNSGTNSEFNTKYFNIYQNDVMKNIPIFPAPGNHDYNNGASTATTVPYFSIFSLPTTGQSGGVPSNNPAYYSYDYGNIHFIALDSYGRVGSDKMYDTLGAQTVWLKADLAANTKPWVVAYWHHPPYTMGSHNSDTEGDLVSIRQRFIRILERNKVDLIITSHSHDYERSKLMNGHYGNEASFNASVHNLSSSSAKYDGSSNSCPYEKDSVNNAIGTVYVVTGSAGQLGGQQGSFPHNAMHYSNATNGGSCVLDIEDNKLTMRWLCADGVIRDEFTMVKEVKKVQSYTVHPNQATILTASWPGAYAWSNLATTRTISASAASDSTIWVKDPNNCITDTFKLNVLPTVSFSATLPHCVSSPIQFSDLSSNAASAWVWSVTPSSGVTISSTTAQNPSIIFSNAGTYSVSLVADNAYGSGIAFTQTLAINANPNVQVSASSSVICLNQSLTLSASGASSYSWNTGSTLSSIAISPSITSTYTLLGLDANGCMNTNTQLITVNALPVVNSISNPTLALICEGDNISLTASGASTYSWTGGIFNATSFTLNTSTDYTVTGTDANGCQNTMVASVTVNPLPLILIATTPSVPVVCSGATLALTAMGVNTFTWNGNVINGTAFVPISSQTYTVTGTDANGCRNTLTQSVTVNPLPVVSINGSSAICVGSSATLTANGASTYVWNTNVTTTLLTVSPPATTSYTVVGKDVNGCENKAIQTIAVNSLPLVTVAGNMTLCAGQTTTITANGASTYSWSNGTSGANLIITPASGFNYMVTGTDANGCKNTASTNFSINSLPVVLAGTSSSLICVGETATLSASGANTYLWSTNSLSATIVVNPTSPTTYSVTGTDLNNCSALVSLVQNVSECSGIAKNSSGKTTAFIYPNPNKGIFTIELNEKGAHSVDIFNTLGQRVYTGSLESGSNRVQLDQNKGIYFYRIIAETKVIESGKIVIE